MTIRTSIVASMFLLVGCMHHEVASADDKAETEARLAEYMSSAPVKQQLINLAIGRDRKFGLQPECGEATVGKILTLQSPDLRFVPERDHPVSGRWQAGYRLERCGEARIHQVVFQADEGNPPKSMYLYSGVSRADEQLLRDAMSVALLSVFVQHPDAPKCEDIALYRIDVTQPPASFESRTDAWKEKWTFWVCGKLHDAVMRFEPNTNGPGVRFFAVTDRLNLRR